MKRVAKAARFLFSRRLGDLRRSGDRVPGKPIIALSERRTSMTAWNHPYVSVTTCRCKCQFEQYGRYFSLALGHNRAVMRR
jgi:hypothetical protein